MDPVEITIARIVTPVTLTQPDGSKERYELREMVVGDRERYLTELQSRMLRENGNVVGLGNFEGHHASLLTRCLYNGDGKPVTKEFVNMLPAPVAEELFGIAQRMNRLAGKQEESAPPKN